MATNSGAPNNGSTASLKKDDTSTFHPQPDWTLISQGAEARLYKIPSYLTNGQAALAKQRFSKSYRHPILDERLTKQRCKAEAKCLMKCRRAGINCPAIYGVYPPVLYMEYIEGSTVREYIEDINMVLQEDHSNDDTKKNLDSLATSMGLMIGKVHNTSVAHGDLTTSNMLLKTNEESATMGQTEDHHHHHVILIDFGLARITTNPEELAVDLYVLERALLSTHPKLEDTDFLDTLLGSYKSTCAKSHAVLLRLGQVRQRGRKRECFG